jgi:hypothetical protein
MLHYSWLNLYLFVSGYAKCPGLSLEKYMSKLNGNNDSFWQRPRDNVTGNDSIWYRNSAVGHRTLGKFMTTISIDAGLSQLYTNHCIKASCITALDDGETQDLKRYAAQDTFHFFTFTDVSRVTFYRGL